MNFIAHIQVMLKPSVNDPQGMSIRGALHTLGFNTVSDVRAGKLIVVRLEASDRAEAERRVDEMASKLLANPVIETYAFTLEESPAHVA